jgi:hypothetical protein
MLKDGEGYIALSPGKHGRQAAIDWFDDCMKLLTVDGRPIVRAHVLGTTAPATAYLHPWASMDATTWIEGPSNGNVIAPSELEEAWWDTIPITDGRRDGAANHLDYRLEPEQDWVRDYIESLGFELSQVRYDEQARRSVYIKGYEKVAKRTGVTIYLVTNLCHHGEREVLDQHNVEHRLINFYDLQNQSKDIVERYLTNNLHPSKSSRRSSKLSYNARMDGLKLARWHRIRRSQTETFTV